MGYGLYHRCRRFFDLPEKLLVHSVQVHYIQNEYHWHILWGPRNNNVHNRANILLHLSCSYTARLTLVLSMFYPSLLLYAVQFKLHHQQCEIDPPPTPPPPSLMLKCCFSSSNTILCKQWPLRYASSNTPDFQMFTCIHTIPVSASVTTTALGSVEPSVWTSV
jgi:hypothetical protein